MNDPDQAGKATDYENKIRSFHGMELRGYDRMHPQPKPQPQPQNDDDE
jgi:hypothetical protein